MKTLRQSFLLLIIIGCGKHNNNANIYGAWQTIVEPKQSQGIADSVVFQKPDSLKIYFIENNKIIESLLGKFYINKNKSRLLTEFDTNRFQFDVIELTNGFLQTRQIGGYRGFSKYRRLTD